MRLKNKLSSIAIESLCGLFMLPFWLTLLWKTVFHPAHETMKGSSSGGCQNIRIFYSILLTTHVVVQYSKLMMHASTDDKRIGLTCNLYTSVGLRLGPVAAASVCFISEQSFFLPQPFLQMSKCSFQTNALKRLPHFLPLWVFLWT